MADRTMKMMGEDDHEASGNYTDRLILLSKHATVFLAFVTVSHIVGSVVASR